MSAQQTAPLTVFGGVRAAIIDLDGTLLDTAPDFHVAINAMRADLALAPLPLATIMRFVGKGSENLVHGVLAHDLGAALAGQYQAQALASYLNHYAIVNGRSSTVFPGVREGLAALQAKALRLACVTNKPIAFARPLLAQNGLLEFFEVLYGGDSLAAKKPDPTPLLQVCRDFDLAPAQVIAIGDSANDAQAARRAGCPVLLLPYGYNHGESVQDVDCDGIVATLLAAAQLLTD
jgi:phosphoglycolate phosphatase